MSKSDLTMTPTGTGRGEKGQGRGRKLLLWLLALAAFLMAAPVAAQATDGLAYTNTENQTINGQTINFGTHPQGNLPSNQTVHFWTNTSSGGFLNTGRRHIAVDINWPDDAYEFVSIGGASGSRNCGTNGQTASHIRLVMNYTGTGYKSCVATFRLKAGASVGNHDTTMTFAAAASGSGGGGCNGPSSGTGSCSGWSGGTQSGSATWLGTVLANTYTGDFRDTGNTTTLTSHEFGEWGVGATSPNYAFVFRNTGNQPLSNVNSQSIGGTDAGDFNLVSSTCPATLGVGGACQIVVNFEPTSVGSRTASLDVNTGNGGTISLPLSGEAFPPTYIPQLQDTAGDTDLDEYTFPFAVGVGEPYPPSYVFTLRNLGNSPLTGVGNQAITGPDADDFSSTTNCSAPLIANATCTITVTFSPNNVGTKQAALEVNTTNGGTESIDLFAEASTGVIETTIQNTAGDEELTSFEFPDTVATGISSYTFTVRNTGNITLQNPSNRSITGDDAAHFNSTTNCGALLPASSTCTVTVNFQPTAIENGMVATLNINPSNGGSSSVALSGDALPPSPGFAIRNTADTADVSSQDLGSPNVGSSSSYVFTVRNSGDAQLNNVAGNQSVTGANAADFSRTTTCPATLMPGASCTVTITFTPSRTGVRYATLNLAPTNAVTNPAPRSVALTGSGAGIRVMNDVVDNYQAIGGQKRWMETGALNPGGSQPQDIVRVAFEVDAGVATEIENVQIANSTTTNDTAPGSYVNIGDLLGGVVNVERKPGSAQALVTAAVPLSTVLGTGNGQYGFSDGTAIGICLFGGDYTTDNRRVWFRVAGSGGAVSAPVGSVVRFINQNYACPNDQGPGIIGQRVASVDGNPVSGNQTTVAIGKNQPVSLQFSTRAKAEGVLGSSAGNVHSVNVRIRNAKTGDLYRVSGGSWQACARPCTADAEFNNGGRTTFPSQEPGLQSVDIPGIPSRGRWIVEGSLRGSDQDLNRFYQLGVLRINDETANGLNVNFGGSLVATGGRPDTDSNYQITATVSDPQDPVNPLDTQGGRIQVIEWDLDGDHTNGPLGDGFEIRREGDSSTGIPADFLTQPFSTTGKTPGPFQIRARITDNGSVLASETVARTQTFVYDFVINSDPEPVTETVYIEADEPQPQNVEFRATDVDNDPYRVAITPNPGNDGSLGGNMNGPIGDNTKPYTWPSTYTGTDTFDFVPTDNRLGTGPSGTLTVKVRPNTTIDSSTFPNVQFNADAGNPATRYLGATTSTSAEFEFSSPQTPIEGYECRLTNDGNVVEDWTECSSDTTGDIEYTGLQDGLHRVEIRAVNEDGDADGTPAFRTWRVDNTGPDSEVRVGPPSNLPNQQPRMTNDTTPTYIFRATSSERSQQQYMTYECRVMFGPAPGIWYPCGAPSDSQGSGPVNIVNGSPDFGIDSPLAEGTYEIQVRATDEVGNLGSVMTEQFTVDITPPETALASGPEGLVNTRTVDYVLGSSQGQSTFLCQLEGQSSGIVFPLGPCPGSAAEGSRPSFSGLADDIYTLTAIAVDPGQNQDPSPLEIEFEVDATEPTTNLDSFDYGDGPTSVLRTQSRKVDVTFSGADTRQLQGFQCRIDSDDENAWQLCSSPQRFSGLADGDHRVEIRAKDEAGNVDSTPEILEWNVDLDPPVTEFTTAPDPVTNDTDPTFEFAADEAVSGSVCSLDGAAPVACTSPLTLVDLGVTEPLADGTHQLTVRSTDIAGNVEQTVASVSWRQDTVLPEVTFTSRPAEFMPLGNANFAWDVKDGDPLVLAPEAEAECAIDPVDPDNIDPGEWQACDRELTIAEADNVNGPHFIAVRAIDEAGNVSPVATYGWTVLGAKPNPPVVDDSSPADGATTRVGTAYFAFSHELDGTGALDGLFCRLDGGTLTRCDGNFGVEGLADGEHTFTVVARDIAGNVSDPATVTWNVQRGAPVTQIDFGPNGASRQTTAQFQFSSDKAGTFECRIDGADWAPCSSPVQLEGLEDGEHSFSVRAVSTVAPVGVKDPTPPTRTWTVDTVAPDVTINSAPEGQIVSYEGQVTFSSTDPEAGFQCKLDDGLFDDCTSPWNLSGLSAGEHTVTVQAVDAAGNTTAEPATRVWVVLDPSCGNDFEGSPPNCVAKDPVEGPELVAKSTGGSLSLATLGSVELPADQVELTGKIGSDGRWFVPSDGVSFAPVVQTIEDAIGPGTVVEVTIQISATGNGWGQLTNGGGAATFKLPVRADVVAKLGGTPLFSEGTECSLRPVTFDLAGTWNAASDTASLEQTNVAFPKLTGCGAFKTAIDGLLELPRSDIELALDFAFTREAPSCEPPLVGTPPDCQQPPTGKPVLSNPVIQGPKKIRFGKKVQYRVRVANTGDAATSGAKICLNLPKRFFKGKAKRCSTANVPAGKAIVKKFTVARKAVAVRKARKVTIRATATYSDGEATRTVRGKSTPRLLVYRAGQAKSGSRK